MLKTRRLKIVGKKKVDKTQDKRIAKLEKSLKAQTQYYSTYVNGVFDQWSGGAYNLTPLSRGTGDSDRLGDRIFVKNIAINLQMRVNTTEDANEAFGLVRVMVIRTKSNEQASPVAAEVFAKATNDSEIFFSPPNKNYRWKYKILHDKYFDLNFHVLAVDGIGAPTIYKPTKSIKIRKRINKQIQFATAATGNIADIEDGLVTLHLIQYGAIQEVGFNLVWQTEYTP
jgi:hypothetical protein